MTGSPGMHLARRLARREAADRRASKEAAERLLQRLDERYLPSARLARLLQEGVAKLKCGVRKAARRIRSGR